MHYADSAELRGAVAVGWAKAHPTMVHISMGQVLSYVLILSDRRTASVATVSWDDPGYAHRAY